MARQIAEIQYDKIIRALCTYQMQQTLPFLHGNLPKIRVGPAGRDIVQMVQLADHAVQAIQKRRLILSKVIDQI